jgi:primosomal protein N' (replication factor Y)
VEIFENTEETLFAELLLPIPVPKLFTYRVPRILKEKNLKGQRAIVQFGDRKILTGLISNVHSHPPADTKQNIFLKYWMTIRSSVNYNSNFFIGSPITTYAPLAK